MIVFTALLCYFALMLLFLLAWRRHCVRMEAYDKAMTEALKKATPRIISAAALGIPE